MKVQFTSDNHKLAGLLDLPTAPPRAYALIAPCFTCSKNSKTAAYLAKSLAHHGIASLRLDFKGLGESEGHFAKNTLSSNIADLIAAAHFLQAEHHPHAPALLIGHSFGGLAVIRAAPQIPTVGAVITVNSPYDPKHITTYFPERLPEIHAHGEATINIAGRPFPIGRDFLHDLDRDDPSAAFDRLHKPILICASPTDDVVSPEHAAQAFAAAHQPKSYLSLPAADHFLSRREDTEYLASLISTWSTPYL
jgi:alpha/beta superfamily hydrolase